jgi:hypothetical protein
VQRPSRPQSDDAQGCVPSHTSPIVPGLVQVPFELMVPPGGMTHQMPIGHSMTGPSVVVTRRQSCPSAARGTHVEVVDVTLQNDASSHTPPSPQPVVGGGAGWHLISASQDRPGAQSWEITGSAIAHGSPS